MKTEITTAAIKLAMTKIWCAPQYALLFEVGNTTGAGARRRADAIYMSLWPSRGLEIAGVEIKVSRSDWQREARDPDKAETIARYCDRWWIHTAPGVIEDLAEVPPNWGWRVFDGNTFVTMREAQRLEPAPLDRAFLAALLRRAEEPDTAALAAAVARAESARAAEIEAAVERRLRERDEEIARDAQIIDAFRDASGIDLRAGSPFTSESDAAAIGAMVGAITRMGGPRRGFAVLDTLAGVLRDHAKEIEKGLRAAAPLLGREVPERTKPSRRKKA